MAARRVRNWRRRRQHAGDPPAAQVFFRLHGHSRAAEEIMAARALDPDFLHRADLDPTAVVVDVGAYTGEVAAAVHDLYGCRVLAFEPSPPSFETLQARFRDVDAVSTFSYGLGATDAVLDLELGGLGSSFHGTTSGGGPTVEVHVRDVVGVLEELGLDRIDLLKVNIEGAEYDLLDRLLEAGALDRVRYLVVQFHEWHPGAHRRRRRIRRALRQTHDQVWDFPWIWEMWCSKAHPHPPRPPITEFETAVLAALRSGEVALKPRSSQPG